MICPAPKATKSSRALRLLAGALLVIAVSGCSRDSSMNFLYPEGPWAVKADQLWDLVFWIATAVFIIVQGLLVYAIFRFRERSAKVLPKQVHGNNKAEIAWTIAPTLLLIGIAVPTVAGIYEMSTKPTNDPVEITVTAHQWWWEFNYKGEDVVTAGEMHIPVDRPVYLSLESVDVIHSFWVPKLAGKQDVVPGRVNNLILEADEAKEYLGQCVEFCGLSHANMQFRVIAHTADDYEAWLEDQKAPAASPSSGLAAEGERLFLEGQFPGGSCTQCHAINGTDAAGIVGPNLTHLASRSRFAGDMFERTDANLEAWLRDPPGRKPGSKMPRLGLKDDEIQALVAYLNTLE